MMFNNSSCWYSHGNTESEMHENLAEMQSLDKSQNANKRSQRVPVFRDPLVNLAPPSGPAGPQMGPPMGPQTGPQLGPLSDPPSQATWLIMVSMVKELNMMMMNLKQANLSQSL